MVGDPARPDLGRRSRVGGDGDLEVFVADEQAQVPVDTARWGRLAEGFCSPRASGATRSSACCS